MNEEIVKLKLRWVICQLASMLNMSVGKVSKSTQNNNKEELINYFCEMKELYLKQENSRIINMLLTADIRSEQDLEFDD